MSFTSDVPISALYEQNRVHHVGPFPKLEDQLCTFCVDFDRRSMGYSPDRLDALVWALTELSEDALGGSRRPVWGSLDMYGGSSAPPDWYAVPRGSFIEAVRIRITDAGRMALEG